jgi:hypothetical protein
MENRYGIKLDGYLCTCPQTLRAPTTALDDSSQQSGKHCNQHSKHYDTELRMT